MINAINTFKLLQNTPSKNDKIAILKKNESPNLKTLLSLCYDQYKTYRVKKLTYPERYNTVTPDLTEELEILLNLLSEHKTGTNDALGMIKRLMEKTTEEHAKWIGKIIERDLDIGCDVSSINKAFPDLISVFKVQLALTVDDRWDKLEYPCLMEVKADGVRCLAVCDGDTVKFYSREGREFTNLDCFSQQVVSLRPGTKFVLDGEIDSKKFNPNNKTAVKNKNGNWKFAQALSLLKTDNTPAAEVKEFLTYKVWDCIDYDFFLSQGKKGVKKTLQERKLELSSLFLRRDSELNNVELMESFVAESKDDLWAYFRECRNNGEEGIMIKPLGRYYEYKRSDAVLKMKEMQTIDLWITDVQEGEGKFEGMVGALICENEQYQTKVGTGMDDDTRLELFVEHLGGRLVGNWVEVSCQEITADGSFRFPVLARLRFDRERVNVNNN